MLVVVVIHGHMLWVLENLVGRVRLVMTLMGMRLVTLVKMGVLVGFGLIGFGLVGFDLFGFDLVGLVDFDFAGSS